MMSYWVRMSRALLLSSKTQWVVTVTQLLRLEEGTISVTTGKGGDGSPSDGLSTRFCLGHTHFPLTVEYLYHIVQLLNDMYTY